MKRNTVLRALAILIVALAVGYISLPLPSDARMIFTGLPIGLFFSAGVAALLGRVLVAVFGDRPRPHAGNDALGTVR